MKVENKNESRSMAFVKFVIKSIEDDKGAAAAFRRADNPLTEHHCWEYLTRFRVNLDEPRQRLPFGLIAAAIVKGKIRKNGSLGIGRAIAQCYDDDHQSRPAKAKLRRLLACDTVSEVCSILRSILRLIEAKCKETLDYAHLLDEILYFESNHQRIQTNWAQNFYRSDADKEGFL